jgi:hypothetical protein
MWAVITTLCIILVIFIYYKYRTRHVPESFVESGANSELYVVYAIDGKDIPLDAIATIASVYGSQFATREIAGNEALLGIMGNTIYPHWTRMGALFASNTVVSLAKIVSEGVSGSASGSGSGSGSASGSASGSQLSTPATVVTEALKAGSVAVPAILLYGPKPPYESSDKVIGGRTYRPDFYNTVRNVWSKYELAQYKCRPIPTFTGGVGLTYGSYANNAVSVLETPGSGNTVNVKITGTADKNRAYPGCNPTCDACEKTRDPFYPARSIPDKNKYNAWKHQPVAVTDDPRVLQEQITIGTTPDPAKISSAIRLVNACREAGGLVVLSAEARTSLNKCPRDSWCCSPDMEIPIMLPLAVDDPEVNTLGATCEPAEEQCDLAPRPAPVDADAYRLSKTGRRSRVANSVKQQFCKSKSASVRTLLQQQKSNKLLGRMGSV